MSSEVGEVDSTDGVVRNNVSPVLQCLASILILRGVQIDRQSVDIGSVCPTHEIGLVWSIPYRGNGLPSAMILLF